MSKYEYDFYGWIQETAQLIKHRRFSEVDIEALLEELESIGRSEKRAVIHRLSVLLVNWLKWRHLPGGRCGSWRAGIEAQRRMVQDVLADSPSLRDHLAEIGNTTYEEALLIAIVETGFKEDTFPATFGQTGWTWEQILDVDFYHIAGDVYAPV